MAVHIAADQAVLTIDETAAVPACDYNVQKTFLFGHLTTGWNGVDFVGDAVRCKGSVPVSGSREEVGKLELGYVQIARATSFKAFYGGRVPGEGGIALDYFVSPAMTTTVLLDGVRNARDPWYRNPIANITAGRGTADVGDHPGMVVHLSLENRSCSNVRNFLFHCFMEREFWTILTALEPGGRPQYIAHVQWRLRYEFRVIWKDKTPQTPRNLSSIKVVRRQTPGRPAEPDLQALLDNPAGERANQVSKRVEAATVTGNAPNRVDHKLRFFTVPENFWL